MSVDESAWLEAPLPAMRLQAEGAQLRWRLNRSAIEGSLDARIGEADWAAVAVELAAEAPTRTAGQLLAGGRAFEWKAVPQPSGWLVWLTPTARNPALAEGAAAQRLALVQGCGRIGFFEWPASGDDGWWDARMFRLFGLPPAIRAPRLDEALAQVHPDDRQALRDHRLKALRHPGRHETRLRIVHPDGQVRDVQLLCWTRADASGRVTGVAGMVVDDTEGATRVREQQAQSREFERALALAEVSVWRIDLESRRIQLNQVGYGFNGLAPRADGMALDEMRALVHPHDLAAVQDAAERAMSGDAIVDVEARYRHSAGGWRHLLTRRVAERDAAGRVVALAGISIDQTERIAERDRAQALARRVQLVADAARIGIWSLETDADGGNERVEWNEHMFRIYGLDPGLGPPPSRQWMGELVHEADRARLAEQRRRARHDGAAGFQIEFRVVRPDGEVRWVVCRNHREVREDRVVQHGIHLDVTPQRVAEQEMRLQQHRIDLATQAAGVGIWERDSATGELRWNEQMYRLRGLEPDDPRSPRRIDEELLDPRALDERWQHIVRHMEDGKPYAFEFALRWPDGSEHWLCSTGQAVRDERGAVVRMIGLNWDVTERRRAEAARREAEAAARASRAKSEFLARMSHELRTPLNAILGFAQLLQHDAADRLNAAQLERLGHIRSAGSHLLSLIDDVLDLSAVEAGSLQVVLRPAAIGDAVDEVREWIGPTAAGRGVALHADRCGGVVLADPRRLAQVVANLLSNAVKYNRRGGSVWVASRRREVDGVAGWDIVVRDDGRGMSAAQLEHLFEPYNRLGVEREGIEGRGIGLPTARHLVQMMGGRIEVTSRVGAGSEFRVWLPQAGQGR